jgi:aldehyde:ferredoxin oxidoreductase
MSDRWFGWKGSILRVNLSTGKVFKDSLPREYARQFLGCRGINAKIMFDELKAGVDPRSPENVLVIGAGPLDGTPVGMGRVSVSAKSYRNTYAEGGFGGFFGPELKFAGYDHIVITGRAEKPVFLYIDDKEASLRDAKDLWGKTTWDTDESIRDELGDPDIQVCCVGPAAEREVHACPIFGSFNRAGGRADCGTVMGGKRLKAVAARGTKGVQVADPDRFEKSLDKVRDVLRLDGLDHYIVPYGIFGSTSQTRIFNEAGWMLTRNAQEGSFEGADKVSGERYLEQYAVKPRACFGCFFQPGCGVWYRVSEGPYSGTVGEGLWAGDSFMFTAFVGVDYLPAALKARAMCNQLGMDVYFVGQAIAWAMECREKGILSREDTDGLDLRFGNHEAVIEMIRKIAYREGFGNILAEGVESASRKIGKGSERYTLTVKGQEIEGIPERSLYVASLGVAVSEVGPDHTRWYPPYPFNPKLASKELLKELKLDNIDFEKAFQTRNPEGKGKLLVFLEDSRAVIESLPSCVYAIRGMMGIDHRLWLDLLNSGTGENYTYDEMWRIGERIRNVERAFIIREGFRRKDDTIPRRFREEPLEKHHIPPLTQEKLDLMLDEYYTARGWDAKTSIPTREKLMELNLTDVIEEFDRTKIWS